MIKPGEPIKLRLLFEDGSLLGEATIAKQARDPKVCIVGPKVFIRNNSFDLEEMYVFIEVYGLNINAIIPSDVTKQNAH